MIIAHSTRYVIMEFQPHRSFHLREIQQIWVASNKNFHNSGFRVWNASDLVDLTFPCIWVWSTATMRNLIIELHVIKAPWILLITCDVTNNLIIDKVVSSTNEACNSHDNSCDHYQNYRDNSISGGGWRFFPEISSRPTPISRGSRFWKFWVPDFC